MAFSSTRVGEQYDALTGEQQVGNHIPCITGGLINYFGTSTFTEYLIEVDRNNYITNEGEKLFSFGDVMETIKKEFVYVQNN